MKGRRAVTAALVGSATASTISIATVTLDCPSSLVPVSTITSGITFTATYCPECEAPTGPAPPVYSGPGYTTTYTTVYPSLCSTGLVPVTHTIVESCTAPTPTWTPGSSYIPPGFTVTTKPCTVCGEDTPTVTITEPCGGCKATNGVVPTPAPTPAGATPPSYAPAPGAPAGSPPSYAPAPQCNGKNCGATDKPGSPSPAPYPAPAGTPAGTPAAPPACKGADCGAKDDSGKPAPYPAPAGTPAGTPAAPPACKGADCGAKDDSGKPAPYPAPAASTSACIGAKCGATDSSNPGGATQIPDGQVQVPTGPAPLPSATPSDYPKEPVTPATGGASLKFISSIVAAISIGALALAL